MAEIPDPSFIRQFQNHRLAVNWLSFSPNSNYLASASDDKTVILWNLSRSNVCYKFSGHGDAVTSVSMANSFMVSGSKDYTARLWRLSDRIDGLSHSSDSSIYRCHQSPIRCVDINADESQFCTSSDDKTVKIWSTTSTNKYIASLSGEHTNWVRHARYSMLSPYLLSSCGDDGVICIWDTRNKEAAIKLTSKRRSTHFLGVQWHPNCEYILSSSSSDFSIRIWDLRYEKGVQCYQVHDGFVSSTDFHSSGNYLISSSVDSTCKILDLYEGRPIFTLRAHTGQVNCAHFSPNGEYFATAGQDHAVLYWKSNLPNIDELVTDEDEDIRSICSFADTPPINTFEFDEIKSIRNKTGSAKLHHNTSAGHVKQEKVDSKSQSPVESVEISRFTPTPPPPPPATVTKVTPESADDVTAGLDKDSCVTILKSILQQLEVITDSIVNIDQRLCTLEDKVDDGSFLSSKQ